MNIIEKLKTFVSKKLLMALLVPLLMFVNAKFGSPIDEASIDKLAYTIIAYILGQSAVDYANTKTGK